ncbi:MAG: hypothetical protein ACR2KU_04580 [Gammaproteobacteria bacterium]|nr:hypothetical protein [Gammaproteobacteria bacterium]MBA3731325.1 hypothetical protein [Gammaproteobacteria bacterium]
MTIFYHLALTALLLGAAVYAHWRLPFHTTNTWHTLISRLILLVVGVAFGVAMATTNTNGQGTQWLIAFGAGFGSVHVPAAAILFLKRQRAES